ncbi:MULTISPECIES: hypothetical protein [Sphingobacterium]|uniref:hypothetical protein n=1 Tax=Sphingobacterium TaxID=28453 RepID=UPI0013D9F294|nr:MULTISPECIES: hypothetical protein [unclassified Sphingobacterium]
MNELQLKGEFGVLQPLHDVGLLNNFRFNINSQTLFNDVDGVYIHLDEWKTKLVLMPIYSKLGDTAEVRKQRKKRSLDLIKKIKKVIPFNRDVNFWDSK